MTKEAVEAEIETFNAKPYKRAMIDDGASIDYTSDSWDSSWRNPQLNTGRGWHNAANKADNLHLMAVEFKNKQPHYVNKLSMQKRGDGGFPERYIK